MVNFGAIHNMFDEDESLPGDDNERYVNLAPVRNETSIEQRLTKLVINANREKSASSHLLRGHTKCGKTTELNRTARRLEQEGYATVMFDVADVATRTFEYTSVLMIMAGQVVEQLAAHRFNIQVKGESQQRLADLLLDKQIVRGFDVSGDLTGKTEAASTGILAALLGKMGLGVEMSGGFQRSREITVRIEANKRAFLESVKAIVQDADERVRRAGRKGLVIICDGCDKLELNAADEHGNTRDLQRDMFENHGPDLRDIPCHVIYTVPISIQSNLQNDWGNIEFVPAIPVNALPGVADSYIAQGRRLLTEVVSRRFATQRTTIEEVFAAPELLDKLISYSGGHISDLLLMVRGAALDADVKGEAQITESMINRSILRRAHDFSFLIDSSHLSVLREIDELKTRPSNSDVCRDVMFKRLALEYMCEESYPVDLHPLVAGAAAYQRYRNPRTP